MKKKLVFKFVAILFIMIHTICYNHIFAEENITKRSLEEVKIIKVDKLKYIKKENFGFNKITEYISKLDQRLITDEDYYNFFYKHQIAYINSPSKIYFSENNEFIGYFNYEDRSLSLHNSKKNKLQWRIEKISTDRLYWVISNDGNSVVFLISGEFGQIDELYFINKDGEIKNEIKTKDYDIGLIRLDIVIILKDRIIIPYHYSEKNKTEPYLICFNPKGKKLWKRNLTYFPLDGFDFLNNLNLIAISCGNRKSGIILIIDIYGNIKIKRKTNCVFSYIKFSENSDYLIATQRNKIMVFKAKTMKLLWKFTGKNDDYFVSPAINDKGYVVVQNIHNIRKMKYDVVSIYFMKDGKILEKYKLLNSHRSHLSTIDNDNNIKIMTTKKIVYLKPSEVYK